MSGSGNGVDLAAIYQAVLALNEKLTSLDNKVTFLDRRMDQQDRKLETLASKDDLNRLRQTVVEYHSAVIGHGVLISEIDDRLRRVEQHLGLSPVS